jgi:hypothetical protein
MDSVLKHMTGEELLLTAIYGGERTFDGLDRELDRRSREAGRLPNGRFATRRPQAAEFASDLAEAA